LSSGVRQDYRLHPSGYSVPFAASKDGTQSATVRRTQGARAVGACDEGEVIVEETPVSAGREVLVTKAIAVEKVRFFKKGMTRNVSPVRGNRL